MGCNPSGPQTEKTIPTALPTARTGSRAILSATPLQECEGQEMNPKNLKSSVEFQRSIFMEENRGVALKKAAKIYRPC